MRGAVGWAILVSAALAACSSPGAAARRGRALFTSAQCGACHRLSGVPGAVGEVGPPLDGIGRRTILAGVLPNTPANLALWIRRPQSVRPGDAMPDAALSPAQARELAAFLETR